MGGNFIVLEEAAYINAMTIKTVVMPVLRVTRSALLMISTLNSSNSNTFNRVVESQVLFTHRVKYVCEECEKHKLMSECKHRNYAKPSWLDDDDDMGRLIFGDDEDLNRENLGIMDSGSRNCFRPELVQALRSRPRIKTFDLTLPPRYIYISIDPSGGSDNPDKISSSFAVVSCVSYGDSFVIVGMEELDVIEYKDYATVLEDHVRNLRSIPGLGGALIVLDVEGNGGSDNAHAIQRPIMSFSNVVTVNDGKRRHGTLTTNPMKRDMMEAARAALERKAIHIYENYVTSHRNPLKLLDVLFQQMLDYEKLTKVSTAPDKPSSVYFSGKGVNKKGRDDMIQTLLRTMMTKMRFETEGQFRLDRS